VKNSLFLTLFFILVFEMAAQNNKPLVISFNNAIEKENNVLGLQFAEVTLINTLEKPILIHAPAYWRFYSTVNGRGITFSERKTRVFDPLSITIRPHDSIVTVLNLNFFDLAAAYSFYSGKLLELPAKASFKLGVYCEYDKQTYYSEEYEIVLKPLDPVNTEASEYIKANDSDPYKFTSIGFITDQYRDKSISDSIMIKYPQSTFAELACLSLAYQRVRETKAKPELKDQVNQLLEKPLKSKYSFVRYLAEELKKKA
jgi:hypothetical protein